MANDTLLAQTPGLEPPPGITPNFENPPSIQSISYAVSAICLFITTLAVGLRIFTKIRVDRNLKLEDCQYLLVFSTAICRYCSNIIQMLQSSHG